MFCFNIPIPIWFDNVIENNQQIKDFSGWGPFWQAIHIFSDTSYCFIHSYAEGYKKVRVLLIRQR